MYPEKIRQQIAKIASEFSIFQCTECAAEIAEFLIKNNLRGTLIKINTGSSETPLGNIYHDGLQQNIATNGQHQGIAVVIESEELIFDNIHHQGIPRKIWLNNLYSPIKDFGYDFQITEIEI